MKKVIVLSIVIILSTLVVSTSLIQADTVVATVWNIETVDSGTISDYISIALDSGDKPHISYHDEANNDLMYARWTGSAWDIHTVDSEGDVGTHNSIALDSSGKPHISYTELNGGVKYARWTGSTWDIETVDPGAPWDSHFFTSIALDSFDKPHISYFDDPYRDLMYARWTGSAWVIEIVDSETVGKYTSIALDSGDKPHISYHHLDQALKYARWTGSVWSIETVDSLLSAGTHTSIALDLGDKPHISYLRDITDLMYARWTGSAWDIQTVDSGIGHASIALDSGDRPHISYHNGGVKYARWTGSAWIIETVDSTQSIGTQTSIAMDSSDEPHVSYRTETSGLVNLKYASKPTIQMSGSPSSQTVTAGSSTIYHISLTQLAGFPLGSISLSLDLPPDVGVYQFNPPSGAPDFNSRLSIWTSNNAPPSTYDLTITATGAWTHTIPLTLTITAKPRLSLNLQSHIVSQGSKLDIWGHLQPARATSIQLYRRVHESGMWTLMNTIKTDSSGDYTHTINVGKKVTPGEYDLKTVWFDKDTGYYAESPIQYLVIQ